MILDYPKKAINTNKLHKVESILTRDIPDFSPKGRFAENLELSIDEFETASKKYSKTGYSIELVNMIKRKNENNLAQIIELINKNCLLHQSLEKKDTRFTIELLKNKINVNQKDRSGKTPLHYAVQSNSLEITRLLIRKGADVNACDLSRKTPFIIALRNKNMLAAGEMLLNGVDFSLNSDKSLFITGIQSDSMKLYMLTKMYFQAKEIFTGGISPEFKPFYKSILIDSIKNIVPIKDKESFSDSIILDNILHKSEYSKEKRNEITKNYITNLKPGNFLWLSMGCIGHAIDLVIKRNAEGNLSLTIANRGLGTKEYHKTDNFLQVYHKTIKFDPPNRFNAMQDKYKFELQLIKAVSEIADKKLGKSSEFDIHKFYKVVDDVLKYKPYLKQFSKEVSDEGIAMLPQFADNCATMSMLSSLGYIYPDKNVFEKIRNTWIEYLETEIKRLAPNIQNRDLNELVKSSQGFATEKYTLNRANIMYEHSKNPDLSIKEKARLVEESLFYYVLTTQKFDTKINIPPSLIEKINTCKEDLRYYYHWSDV